ncbi:MAG: acetylglutamate kinase [Firmicutes bacterium]|jgi:acetylglutamate kinase|uniref:acetylglutamate kinase n=1 Tax=Sulfobacillus benefaciens TaxID=453960 RepID=A0A2T2X9D9_9FIRM|nr:acetylglutamate kinase [Bacillota bacterium]MCL5013135.1 acetylglutamate kinase [Bacillota bacterium]PSR31133.1 MAG: acetylglutamate kinase [Sulfobacillus benefaciens]
MRIVMKIGGSVLTDVSGTPPWVVELRNFLEAGHEVAIVHGGGPAISQSLEKAQVPVQFYQGQRVTSPEVLRHVVRILRGEINASLVNTLNRHGLNAVGLSGIDGTFMTAEHLPPYDLGSVGTVIMVDSQFVEMFWSHGMIPVIAPLASTRDHAEILNCNADGVAQGVAATIAADLLIFYTVTGGLRMNPEDDADVVRELSRHQIEQWIRTGRATGGMIPKLQAAWGALEHGVSEVLIGSFYGNEPATRIF